MFLWLRRIVAVSVLALSTLIVPALGFWSLEAQEKGGVKGTGPEIVATLKGHTELVYAVAFSQDGKHVATASFDNTVKLWETATGKEAKTFAGPLGHTKMVLSVAFSNDGSMIASGGVDNTLKVWDVPVNSPLRTLAVSEAAHSVALAADGTKIAVGTKDGLVKIFNPADFKELAKMEGHQGAVTSLSFSPNGQILASAGVDKTVRFWNPANGQLIASVGAHTGPVNGVTIHTNNTAASSVGDDGQVKIWNVPPTPSRLLPGHTAAIGSMFVTADGATVLTASADKTIRQSLVAGKEIRVLTGPNATVTSVALNPQNTLIAGGTADNRVHLWNAADGKPITQYLAHNTAVTSVNFHPTQPQLMTTGMDGLVKVWAVPPAAPRILTHPEAVLVSVAGPNNKLYTGGADKTVRVWDLAKLVVEKQLTGHPGPVTAIAAGNAVVSGGGEGSIRFWDMKAGKESDILTGHSGAITSLALNPAGTQLLSASADGRIKLWQLPLSAPRTMAHPEQVTCLAVSQDGNKLLTGGADKQARLWDLAKGAKERDYAGPTLPITSVALSLDGKFIAAGSADKTVHVWSVGDAKVLNKITFPAAVQAVAFSPDAKFIAAGLADNAIKLFEAMPVKDKDGKTPEPKTLAGHKGAVTALAYSAKGDLLFSASADKTIQTWAMPGGEAKAKFELAGPIADLSLSKDGSRFAGVSEKVVKLWNVADGKEVGAITAPADVKGVAIAPDNTRLVVACADKLARIYGVAGDFIEAFAHDGPVNAVAFVNPKTIVSAGADKVAKVWTSAVVWQKAHGGPVRQAIFSPKGDQIISASDDKTVKIWNAADGKDLKTLAAHEGAVFGLGLSADGTKLATTGADKTVKVWNLAAKPGTPDETKPAASFNLPADAQSITLSPNGARLAVGITEKEGNLIRVFDLGLNREIQVLIEHGGPIAGLSFQGDNRTLLTASQDKTAKLLDVNVVSAFDASSPPLDKGGQGGVGIIAAQYHSNGTQLLTAGVDKNIKLWDLTKNAVIKTFGPLADPIKFAGFNRDFTQVGAAAGKTAKVWNIADGKEILSLAHAADVLSLGFNVGKTHVVTGGTDKIVKMYNLATGALERSFTGSGATVRSIAIAKNNALLAAGGDDAIVRIFNPVDGKELVSVKTPAAVKTLSFTANNAILVAACADKSMLSWSVPFQTGQPLAPDFLKPVQNFIAAEAINDLTIAPDSASIFTASKEVGVWKLASPNPTRNFSHPNNVDVVAFQPNGTLLASGCHDGKVRIFDLVKNALLREINAHTVVNATMIYSIAFSPDGKQLVSCSYDQSLKLWDVNSGNLVKEFKAYKVKEFEKGHEEGIFSVAFSPDGKLLASGSGGLERVIKIWDVASGNPVRDLANPNIKSVPGKPASHPGWVYSLRFTKDGKHLISVGDAPLNKGFLAVWNPNDGKLLYDETMPLGSFFGLALSPNEQLLAIGAGPRGRPTPDFNSAYLLKMPKLGQ